MVLLGSGLKDAGDSGASGHEVKVQGIQLIQDLEIGLTETSAFNLKEP